MIELGDIEGRNTDSDVDHYLVNRGASEDYRDAARAADCDVSKSSAVSNLERNIKAESERTIKRLGSHLRMQNKYKSFRKNRFRSIGRRNVFGVKGREKSPKKRAKT